MPCVLDIRSSDFEVAFVALLNSKRESSVDVRDAVAAVVEDVRLRGDAALIDYTTKWDRLTLTPETLRVSKAEIDAAVAAVPADRRDALAFAADRIRAFHAKQLPAPAVDYIDETGVRLGARWTAVESVGLYVPGGLASYPSSVLMNALPAVVAGVPRIAMVVPTPGGEINPLVLAAARICGVEEIYRIGGAQAVAALAHGTATVPAVVKIVGPGNAFVAAAKRHVYGLVGIDSIAGPSEIVVVADDAGDPDWTAIDLLSQAEHDPVAQSILITDSVDFADKVRAAVDKRLDTLPRAEIAGTSWRDHGAVILVRDLLADAPALIDRLAPEHLELAVADPEPIAARVRNVGAIFLGRFTPEAIGDYVAGPNHVLPTARSARFSSGLNVLDFMKRTTFVACDAASIARIGPAAVTLAGAEGLDAHGLSVAARLAGRSA